MAVKKKIRDHAGITHEEIDRRRRRGRGGGGERDQPAAYSRGLRGYGVRNNKADWLKNPVRPGVMIHAESPKERGCSKRDCVASHAPRRVFFFEGGEGMGEF